MANPANWADMLKPEFQIKQAKYENARIAIDRAYRLAIDWGKYDSWEDFVTTVGKLKALITKDLDDTLKLLDDKDGTTKAQPPTVPRTT